MTQFCIEEAAGLYYQALLDEELAAEQPPARPGEITDPVMQNALAAAKREHQQHVGPIVGMGR